MKVFSRWLTETSIYSKVSNILFLTDLGIEKFDGSMKYNIDYHNFRERNKERDIHNNAFNTSSYLSKAASIEKALKDG